MNRVMRIRAGMLLTIAVLGFIVLVAFSQQEKETAIAPDVYKEFMAHKVADIYDLQDWFIEQQASFLPIIPPDPEFVLKQSGIPMVLPFDWVNFPAEFNKSLTAEYENGVPVYPVTILEDSITRESIFLHAKGDMLLILPPPKGYDPFTYLKAIFPSLYAGWYSKDLIAYWEGFYDPARIQISVKLIPVEYVEPYLYVSDRLAEESALSAAASGGGGAMLLRSPEAESNIVFEAFKRTNAAGNRIVIGYPDEFTNRLDVFTCNDLMPYIWTFATKGLATSGTNEITWIDTNYWAFSGPTLRFYAAGNAELDTDGDGYSDAGERLVYITDPANSNSRPVFVSGTISYTGIETGTIYVLAARSEESWSPAGSAAKPGPGAWSNEVGINQSYWFRAFRDVNTNYIREAWEPWGYYSNTATTITGNTSGLNITLQDQPSVWGSLSYTGSVNGDIWVLAVTSLDSWDTTYNHVIPWASEDPTGGVSYTSFPVNYSISGLPASNYWIRAFVDSNTNELMNLPELAGQYGATAIAVSNRRTGINFSLQAPPSVSGIVSYTTYSGGQTGLIYVLATVTSNSCATNYSDVLDAPGSYQLTNLPVGIYWVWAWRDSDGNHACDTNEARGYFTNSAIFVTGQLVNANINMTDPDGDGDGMGDWWEKAYFGGPEFGYPEEDLDEDKLMNLYEYYAGTIPTSAADTDGDGMSDDWEIYYELDTNWNGDAALDTDQDGWTNLEEYDAGTDPTVAASHPGNCWYVATNGVDQVGRGGYTNPLETLLFAFDCAANGHRVILLPGIYTNEGCRNLSLVKSIVLSGLQDYRDSTVIDCKYDYHFLQLSGASDVLVRYLTVSNALGYSAIYIDNSDATFLSCTFASNRAPFYGGAIYVSSGALTAADCLFEGNSSLYPGSSRGGALYSSGPVSLSRCRFLRNSAAYGGAIDTTANLDAKNCLFIENCAETYGGVVYSYLPSWGNTSFSFENCTIVSNSALSGGSAIYTQNQAGGWYVSLINCIVWGNSTGTVVNKASPQYSCLQWSADGAGNIFTDPLFESDGWHLTADSPCRNAGSNRDGQSQQTDLDGGSRIEEDVVDMGADEFAGFTNRFHHMPSHDQSNTWGITVVGATTRVWVAAAGIKAQQLPLSCWFHYGDGQQSATVTVLSASAARYIGATHAYAATSVYEVTAFLRDHPGVTTTQTFHLACRATSDYDARASHAIEDGLLWLYTNATHALCGCYWTNDAFPGFVASANGMALTAFAAFGHRSTSTNVVYTDVLDQGLSYLLAQCLQTTSLSPSGCTNYNPDVNTNGFGITIKNPTNQMYEIGPVLTALVGVGAPDETAPAYAPTGIMNRSYSDVAQDIVDFCGWAQADEGMNRGGWRYQPHQNPDNSASMWPASGLFRAQAWDEITIPNGLKVELTNWVAYSQRSDGSFGYDTFYEPTLGRTAYGLVQLAFLDRPLTNDAVQRARSYLGTNFIEKTTDLYCWHALAMAAAMFEPDLEIIGTQSWRYAFATKLLADQEPSGAWMGSYNDGSEKTIGRVFGTAAAISILAEATPWRILVTQWARTPASTVTPTDTVSFRAVTLPRPEATNLTLTTWYRTAATNDFASLVMTNILNTYTTTTAIPALPVNTKVEYFLEAVYERDGAILTNRYPSACEEDHLSYTVQP